MIEAEHLTKRHGDLAVVRDVTLKLPAGGMTAIIGPNGAGKSTLLSMIGRLLPMSEGRVLVDGLDVARTPGDVLARRLAILRQDNHMPARLTVRDLVTFGRFPHSHGRPTMEDRAHVDRALGHLALEALADRFLDELSGGQRQRAFIAMALCQDTDYLLLDEPLNSLDMKHAVAIMRLLRRAATELRKTVVLVLHDLNFAACHADRIVAMRDGRVVVQGAPEEIMRPEVIRAIYDLDATIHDVNGARVAFYYR